MTLRFSRGDDARIDQGDGAARNGARHIESNAELATLSCIEGDQFRPAQEREHSPRAPPRKKPSGGIEPRDAGIGPRMIEVGYRPVFRHLPRKARQKNALHVAEREPFAVRAGPCVCRIRKQCVGCEIAAIRLNGAQRTAGSRFRATLSGSGSRREEDAAVTGARTNERVSDRCNSDQLLQRPPPSAGTRTMSFHGCRAVPSPRSPGTRALRREDVEAVATPEGVQILACDFGKPACSAARRGDAPQLPALLVAPRGKGERAPIGRPRRSQLDGCRPCLRIGLHAPWLAAGQLLHPDRANGFERDGAAVGRQCRPSRKLRTKWAIRNPQ